MVRIEEAKNIISNQDFERRTMELSLEDCLGFYTAQNVFAPFDIPAFDNSAMDGYAICGNHESYTIVGEVAAGHTDQVSLQDGEAMRIFTGAKIPDNASAVVMQEKTTLNGENLSINEDFLKGKNIRRQGSEIKKGEIVFEKGHKLSPAGIGMLANFGISKITVYQKPRVSLLTTGNEIVSINKSLMPGQIYDSNSYMLSAALKDRAFALHHHIHTPDNLEDTIKHIERLLDQCDVLLISGGISVGDYDFVGKALKENGVEELFYKVFQKPGKPLFFGRKDETFVFGLPGNPASSLTCYYIYVLPFLIRLSGNPAKMQENLKLPIAHDYQLNSDRPTFLKAKIENGQAYILEGQGSSMILSMAKGDALVFLEGKDTVLKGERVNITMI